MGMVDITEKAIVRRQAEAGGRIFLSPDTIEKIETHQIKKGDPLLVAEVSAMNAAKQTYLLIPHDQISAQMNLAGLAARYTYIS